VIFRGDLAQFEYEFHLYAMPFKINNFLKEKADSVTSDLILRSMTHHIRIA
jgi:hypothetical protein